ncbi:MAG: alpha/beta hydrolase [Clostridiales bacterium]|nr:alpha/beta hydrolase [Clostridiales bacterium]
MDPIRGSFRSSDGENEIAYYIWEPEGAPSAVVQLSHGMCEYALRYAPYAEHLASRGIVFAGNDHLGHGAGARESGNLGYIADEDGPDLMVSDLHTMTGILKERYPGVPVILLGFSMGSFLCRLYLSSFAEDLSGAIVMGTGGPDIPVGLGLFLTSSIAMFRGKRHPSPLLAKISFAGYTKRCAKEEGSFAWLSKDPETVKQYESDPLCGFTFTVGGFSDLYSAIGAVSTDEWAASIPTDLPILVVSGSEDPVGGYGKGVMKVVSMLSGAGARRLTAKLFPKDRHELLNETDREKVYEYIDGWIDSEILSAAAGDDGHA